jgi:hypothetical protein
MLVDQRVPAVPSGPEGQNREERRSSDGCHAVLVDERAGAGDRFSSEAVRRRAGAFAPGWVEEFRTGELDEVSQ